MLKETAGEKITCCFFGSALALIGKNADGEYFLMNRTCYFPEQKNENSKFLKWRKQHD